MIARGLLCLALALGSLPAVAHKASDSYLRLAIDGTAVTGQWDIALRDAEAALGIDANGDGLITWGELRRRRAELDAWALARLSVERGGGCRLAVSELLIDTHSDGSYAVLKLDGDCPAAHGEATIAYRLLFEIDALHRGLLNLELDGEHRTAVFSPERKRLGFASGKASPWTQFAQYLREGVHHIWIGYDHILFLLALLFPAVLVRENRRWRGVPRFPIALRETLWVVTAFTIAHSITLSAAVLGLLALPSRLVESAIAASVVLAAANNLCPIVDRRRWLVAFAFGLIHGFGFASVLAELGLPSGALAVSLLAFNLGVEFGQIAIVALFLPVAFRLRDTDLYRRRLLPIGSAAALVLALFWLVQRAFDL